MIPGSSLCNVRKEGNANKSQITGSYSYFAAVKFTIATAEC